MQLKPGLRLRSTVCSTEIVVMKTPDQDSDLWCGGEPMVAFGVEPRIVAAMQSDYRTGSLIGKRYVNDDEGLEIIVTKSGEGGVSLGARLLREKAPKKLPSSD